MRKRNTIALCIICYLLCPEITLWAQDYHLLELERKKSVSSSCMEEKVTWENTNTAATQSYVAGVTYYNTMGFFEKGKQFDTQGELAGQVTTQYPSEFIEQTTYMEGNTVDTSVHVYNENNKLILEVWKWNGESTPDSTFYTYNEKNQLIAKKEKFDFGVLRDTLIYSNNKLKKAISYNELGQLTHQTNYFYNTEAQLARILQSNEQEQPTAIHDFEYNKKKCLQKSVSEHFFPTLQKPTLKWVKEGKCYKNKKHKELIINHFKDNKLFTQIIQKFNKKGKMTSLEKINKDTGEKMTTTFIYKQSCEQK